MKKITVSAPGKLFLFGEHAVMYGQPCIVTALSKKLKVTLEEAIGKIVIHSPQSKDTRFIDATLAKFGITRGISITTQSDFSGMYGFGSSAAVTVGLVAALSKFLEKSSSHQQIFEQAFEIISNVQETGSGADVAASVFGGTLFFQNSGEIIDPIMSEWKNYSLVVGYSGVKANTVALISQLAQKKSREPEKFMRIMSAIGKVVLHAKGVLEQNDWERVGKYMDFNQEYLRDLGISTQKLEDMILAAKKAGACGAKLSGAGGGDSMIALVSADTKTQVEEAIVKVGGEVVNVGINEIGVRFESNT